MRADNRTAMLPLVVKAAIPEYIPISPITLPCPRCYAEPGEECENLAADFLQAVHLARIKAAVKMDAAEKKRR
jgi:hypothetical protein